MHNYPLPADTNAAFRRFDRCQNPGLLFERYSPDLRSGEHLKKPTLEKVQRCLPDRTVLDACRLRWHAMVSATGAAPFEAKTDWRFITGLGRKGPLEVGFTFHRIYGFPIIPGSGLKGLARAWAYFALREAAPGSKPEENPDFVTVFGRAPEGSEDESAASTGGAVFFEAIPLDDPRLEIDVMNPHYPDYYGDKRGFVAPTDGQNPKPVFFLTVEPGVRFAFAVGWRGEPNADAHALTVEWLQKGLDMLGAGAKTSAGYGFWQILGAAKMPQPPKSTRKSGPTGAALSDAALTWRRGKITKIDTSRKHRASLMDVETEQVYRFSTRVIEGDTPGRKSIVRYAVRERDGEMVVVKVKK